jgi:hypothetical protein
MIQKSEFSDISTCPIEEGSQLFQSALHNDNGLTVTIQFHHGIIGLNQGGGVRVQTRLAGHQKHIAVHCHQVKVGVTKILRKLVGELVHKYHQAHNVQPHNHQGKENGDNGHINGIGTHNGHEIQVNAEKIGIHSQTFNQSHIGIPNKVGSCQGARGAQFRGVVIHHHQPKPQLKDFIKSSIFFVSLSTFSLNLSNSLPKLSLSLSNSLFDFNKSSSLFSYISPKLNFLFCSLAYSAAFSGLFFNSFSFSSKSKSISLGSFSLFKSQIGSLFFRLLYFLFIKLSELNILILSEQFLLSLLIIISQYLSSHISHFFSNNQTFILPKVNSGVFSLYLIIVSDCAFKFIFLISKS